MKLNTVKIQHHEHVAEITMNCPSTLNALSEELVLDLEAAVADVNSDDNVRVVILTGAGRGFGAGADKNALQDVVLHHDKFCQKGSDVRVRFENSLAKMSEILQKIRESSKPWISVVNGPAAGASCGLAWSCSTSIMADDAYHYISFSRLGAVPDAGTTWQLVRNLGAQKASAVIFNAQKISAQETLSWGLCSKVVPTSELRAEAMALAKKISDIPPLVAACTTQLINEARENDIQTIIDKEFELQMKCFTSSDFLESVTAHFENRKPVWTGA